MLSMEPLKIVPMNGITDFEAEKSYNPKGATKNEHIGLSFDRRLALEFHGAKISSDAGLLAYREMDEVLGLTSMGGRVLNDWRTGKNTQHSMLALIRQSIYGRLAGYEDTNDAERLAVDPIMRHVVGGRATEHAAASTSQMARFETEVLAQTRNLATLLLWQKFMRFDNLVAGRQAQKIKANPRRKSARI